MFIVDLNQIMYANIAAQMGLAGRGAVTVDENMVRHMVLNTLRSFRQKFKVEYGEMIIACDTGNYWRRKIFPHYKANRKTAREASGLDWKSIFQAMKQIRVELKEFFPYRVIEVDSAEADDVISTLVHKYGNDTGLRFGEKLLILSGDKDFIQLHRFSNVEQYDPVRKKWIKHDDPRQFLREHVLKGAVGDGVPNILSPDDCFISGQRQTPLTQKKMDYYLSTDPIQYQALVGRNYHRNKQLIDLSCIPEEVKVKIMEQYSEQADKPRSKLLNYFISNKLRHLLEHINEF